MARRSRKGVSKSAAIREYKAKHKEAKPKEIAANLNQAGYEVTPQYVSTILSGDQRKANGSRRGPRVVRSSFENLLAAKKLVSEVGGVEAAQEAIAQYSKLMA